MSDGSPSLFLHPSVVAVGDRIVVPVRQFPRKGAVEHSTARVLRETWTVVHPPTLTSDGQTVLICEQGVHNTAPGETVEWLGPDDH